ncbi:cytochrome D1 domain-containing protein [Anaeromyxobacter oryzae]|uniref:Membrane protein n=1 Tax=Anaeromyxobacter oryzae TaxID=2918170 RepID=A0ABM7WQR3_9BACT|nr:cytochrome D1 domain-containing protein [Anaeromyxobacter oryzae]BDG01807.1 membrane protein [Anaeromyxobacter oryzae]
MPTVRARALLVLAGVSAATLVAARAQAAPPRTSPPLAFVSNEGDGTVTVIDTARDAVLATIPVGKRPRGLRLDRSGTQLYVAVSGSPRAGSGVTAVGLPDRSADGIAVVDVARRALVSTVAAGADPETFDVVPGSGRLVVSNEEAGTAAIVDAATGAPVASVGVGAEPEGVAARPDGRVVAVTSEGSDRVDFVDPARGVVLGSAGTCRRPRGVAFTPDGALAVVACEDDASIAILDGRALRAVSTVPLPPATRPMGVAISADGRRAYVSGGRAGTVLVVDLARLEVTGRVRDVGERPWGLALTPDGRKLYVATGPSGDVAVIDTASLTVKIRVRTGALPWGVAISG